MSLKNPTGQLHEFERRPDEPWTARWHRMFGVMPKMREKKSVSNADPARSKILSASKIKSGS